MDFISAIKSNLPAGLNISILQDNGNPMLWKIAPELAAAAKLSDGLFDTEDYLNRYPDVRKAGVDPIWHFIKHGIYEGRTFSIVQRSLSTVNIDSDDILDFNKTEDHKDKSLQTNDDYVKELEEEVLALRLKVSILQDRIESQY